MEISKRLQTIAQSVQVGTNTVVDVGTDHGYIPIYLIKNNIANKCIACDINPMPLDNAKNNINHYNMCGQIQTRLGGGLSQIKKGEADTIIIAGMGGMLIIDILKENPNLVKEVGLLILQPQLDIVEVRKYIHSIDFTIIDEQMVYEDGKYYTVISAAPAKELGYSEQEYKFGKIIIDKKELVFKNFLESKIKELKILQSNLSKANTLNSKNRLLEVEDELRLYEEVIRCQ